MRHIDFVHQQYVEQRGRLDDAISANDQGCTDSRSAVRATQALRSVSQHCTWNAHDRNVPIAHTLTHTNARSYTQANDDPSLQPLELCALFRIYASGILCEKYLQPAAAVLLVSILHAVAKNPTCRARYGECFES